MRKGLLMVVLMLIIFNTTQATAISCFHLALDSGGRAGPVAAAVRCSWQNIVRSLIASARAVKIPLYIILLLPIFTTRAAARAAARAEVYLPRHLPWDVLAGRRRWAERLGASVWVPAAWPLASWAPNVSAPAFERTETLAQGDHQ